MVNFYFLDLKIVFYLLWLFLEQNDMWNAAQPAGTNYSVLVRDLLDGWFMESGWYIFPVAIATVDNGDVLRLDITALLFNFFDNSSGLSVFYFDNVTQCKKQK